jgi:hypothetical protein
MILRPFFSYYGSKWRIANRYPAPKYAAIIEPFAGSAGYSLNYHTRKVVLYDRDPHIAYVWQYLIHVSEREILALPDVPLDRPDFHLDDLRLIEEQKWLIGFWFNHSNVRPQNRVSPWMRKWAGLRYDFWGSSIRERIASQLKYIRHWGAYHADYTRAPNVRATWFIDPPYCGKTGDKYRCAVVDYEELGTWSGRRKGQTIVCEGIGADWLPFESIGHLSRDKVQGRVG